MFVCFCSDLELLHPSVILRYRNRQQRVSLWCPAVLAVSCSSSVRRSVDSVVSSELLWTHTSIHIPATSRSGPLDVQPLVPKHFISSFRTLKKPRLLQDAGDALKAEEPPPPSERRRRSEG
ncbi:hypothetical protein FQA47_020157 [Oryzias melastigma]|uniref:Uncharacterized protein n=1 Tax=Oryzias melastigma TaxID=30732 RepID=A0A834FSF9_ORYME|nr:hypothetical protein FQA47_020157 [Oryzias melastigma]